jgi:hypothetical protein
MIKKPNNWENVKAATERAVLPKGGYVVKILDAKQVDYDWGSKLEISVDIIEGDFKDFYANDYRAQTQEDKKWKGVLRQYIPKDDGSEKDEWTKSSFKAMTEAIEDSNSGYHFDWNEAHMKGKIVGCLFRSEEWAYGGKTGFATRAFKFIPADNIRQGKFKLPKDKFLSNGAVSYSESGTDDFQEIPSSDDDLPF